MDQTLEARQDAFDRAELTADHSSLQDLIAEDFLSIGPKGFVLDKQQWIGRHGRFRYLSLDVSDRDIRTYGDAAIVRNVQRNRGTHDGDEVVVAVRVSQVWVRQDARWQIAGIQFSPLADA